MGWPFVLGKALLIIFEKQRADIEKGKKKPKKSAKKESTPECRDEPEDLPHFDDQGIGDNEGERKYEE